VRILAYRLMSNHVHLVAIPEEPQALGIALRRTHLRYALSQCAPGLRWASLAEPILLLRAGRTAFVDRASVCGTQPGTGEPGGASGRVCLDERRGAPGWRPIKSAPRLDIPRDGRVARSIGRRFWRNPKSWKPRARSSGARSADARSGVRNLWRSWRENWGGRRRSGWASKRIRPPKRPGRNKPDGTRPLRPLRKALQNRHRDQSSPSPPETLPQLALHQFAQRFSVYPLPRQFALRRLHHQTHLLR